MPDVILPFAKSWAALIVAVLTGVSAVADFPQWLTVVLAGLSVVAVYGVPNGAASESTADPLDDISEH